MCKSINPLKCFTDDELVYLAITGKIPKSKQKAFKEHMERDV